MTDRFYVGIVGAEEAKFTRQGEKRARHIIHRLLLQPNACLVSGHCHLGGIDIWAEEIAVSLGVPFLIFPPKDLTWSTGFKPRNLRIAEQSSIVYCITVDHLPKNFNGIRFKSCYHCRSDSHVKSGGCWTMHHCSRHKLYIVSN